jgi:hypothetical protein
MARDAATATLERAPVAPKERNGVTPAKPSEDEGIEHEIEFDTPFGKLEFEFEPRSRKAKKDEERKKKREQQAALAAEQSAKKAAEKAAKKAERAARGRRGGGLLIVLAVLALIGIAVAVAWWLFAHPEEDEQPDFEAVPPELREAKHELEVEQRSAPQRLRDRLRNAVRAGRRASREAQDAERQRFEEMARQA